ncbi:MAG: EAL domain-containing protein, partial [Pseudomonadota bacterium]|nr:EAL domain-containing protein [Pseudomonadota bacterium]
CLVVDNTVQRSPLRLLLIEDSADDALLLQRELHKGGLDATVHRVDRLDALCTALADGHWDIVISDHNVPGIDTIQGLTLVRKADNDIPIIIIVSGTIGEEIAVETMRHGANDYIMKGSLTRLVPAIKRELREAQQRQTLRQAEATIHHMAYHDALTGLVNRVEFERRLQRALQSAQAQASSHVLLYLDLDQFKIINDTCGHLAGDELLRCLTIDLLRQVRNRDTLARLGGDEFGVLLENCTLDRALEIAETIREAIQNFRFSWKKYNFAIGVSIGATVINQTSRSVEEVMSGADMACYAAKDLGRNRVHLYRADDAELNRRHSEMQWASRIAQAVQEDRFVLYEHAIVALNEGAPVNYREFLIRMVDETGDIILPYAFIPAAERYNMMTTVDRWVINTAFRQLACEQGSNNPDDDSKIAFINLSGTSLSDEGLLDHIHKQLLHYQLPPHTICFEITETAAITDFRNALNFVHKIKALGCRFALDDFGSGMSSFSYLKRIPVDFIKIDGRFVKNMEQDAMDQAIVRAIADIAHVGGIQTIAEFVQDKTCITMLRKIGVNFAQGHGIDLPKPIACAP